MLPSGVATFSATVSDEKSAPSWNIMPNRVRRRASSPADAVQTSVPRSRTVPAVGRSRPMISRNSTDLPVPLPPMIATTCPRAIENETPSWIVLGPKRVTMSSTSRTGCPGLAAVAACAGITGQAPAIPPRTPH